MTTRRKLLVAGASLATALVAGVPPNQRAVASSPNRLYLPLMRSPRPLLTPPWPMEGYNAARTGRSPCVGPQSADVIWTYSWEPVDAITFNADTTSPVVSGDGTIYVGIVAGYLYSISPDGTLRWRCKTGRWIDHTPAVSPDGTVYVNCGKLKAFDPEGHLAWEYSSPDGTNASTPVTLGPDGTVYVGWGVGYLYAIDRDGVLKWRHLVGGACSAAALDADGNVYVGSRTAVYSLYPNGTERWNYPVETLWSPPTPTMAGDGTVYFGGYGNETLTALKPDGTWKWSYPAPGGLGTGVALGDDGTIYVYVVAGNGALYALWPNGTLRWTVATGGNYSSDRTPIVGGDGTIYVQTRMGTYAVSPGGSVAWTYPSGSDPSSSAAIGSNGVLYVGSSGLTLVLAIGAASGQ